MAPSRTGTRARPNGGGTRPTFDLDAAFAYFAADPDRTYGDVAKAFGVSDTTVRKWARRLNWEQRARDVRRQAADKLLLKSLEERNRDTLRAVSKARTHLLSDQADAPKWSDLPGLVKLEQLIEGEATSRVAVTEVRDVIVRIGLGVDRALRDVLDEHLANGKRRLVLAGFREQLGVVLEQAAGGLVALEAGE